MDSDQINIIPSYQINKEKWDYCIKRSVNDLMYAQSYYLDALADNWHGIVVNDYDCVMPVPWRKKLGIRYCYDVPFIQQLGYFSTTDFDNTILINTLFKFIRYGYYNFNYSNNATANIPEVRSKTNLILDLFNKEVITDSFTKSFMQSLQHASGFGFTYVTAAPVEAIEMYKDLYRNKIKNITEDNYKNLFLLTQILITQGKCFARKIINKNGNTISIVLLLKDERRLYNIINATCNEGRNTEANYFLYEQLFNEFAGQELLFDLEGSDLPGVKNFYKKMGAKDQPYFRMHINNLPFPLKLFKK